MRARASVFPQVPPLGGDSEAMQGALEMEKRPAIREPRGACRYYQQLLDGFAYWNADVQPPSVVVLLIAIRSTHISRNPCEPTS